MKAGWGSPRPRSPPTDAEGEDSPHPLPKTTMNRSMTHVQVHTPPKPKLLTGSCHPHPDRQTQSEQGPVHGGATLACTMLCKSALDLELLALPLHPNFCPVNTMRLMIPYEHQDLVTKTSVRQWRRTVRG